MSQTSGMSGGHAGPAGHLGPTSL